MSMNRTYAVLGLGRYGRAVAEELVKSGAEVIAIDENEEYVNDASAVIPICKCADITDSEVVEKLGIANVDVVIVAMASNLEASVMAVTLCKEVGVPTVIAKCSNELHQKILSRVGADRVVFPEKESGTRLAKNILSSGFADLIELSEDISMVELDVKSDWEGKTLLQLDLRKKYSMNVVAIRKGEAVVTDIDPQMPLEKDMKLIVIANVERLNRCYTG